jgi:hypothetical protein
MVGVLPGKTNIFFPCIMDFWRRKNYLAHNNVFKRGKYLKGCCAHSKTTSVIRLSI